jgi:hypothetical protein
VMMGNDENCQAWLNANREGAPVDDGTRPRRKSKREEFARRGS